MNFDICYCSPLKRARTTAEIVLQGRNVPILTDDRLVEMVEVPANNWHLGVQFHPEFKSRPNRPHPLFASFIKAAKEYSENK